MDPIRWTLEGGEDRPVWLAEIEVDAVDYGVCAIGDAIELSIGERVWSLVVIDRPAGRTGPEGTWTIRAVSPLGTLAPLTRAWASASSAAALAADVLAPLIAGGYPLTWSTVDWSVPADSITATLRDPDALVTEIAEAVGAVVESAPDGSVTVRACRPWDVVQGAAPAPIATLTEDDVCAWSLGPRQDGAIVDRLTIASGALTTGAPYYEVSWSDAGAVLTVYPEPGTDVTITHCGLDSVTVSGGDLTTVSATEAVSVVRGRARVAPPIADLVGHTWARTDLGALRVDTDPHELVAAVVGESRAAVSYTAARRAWTISAAEGVWLVSILDGSGALLGTVALDFDARKAVPGYGGDAGGVGGGAGTAAQVPMALEPDADSERATRLAPARLLLYAPQSAWSRIVAAVGTIEVGDVITRDSWYTLSVADGEATLPRIADSMLQSIWLGGTWAAPTLSADGVSVRAPGVPDGTYLRVQVRHSPTIIIWTPPAGGLDILTWSEIPITVHKD